MTTLPHREYKVIKKATDGAPKLTVATFNMLASSLATEEAFPHTDPKVLDIHVRMPLIIAEILRADPDIICMQEVDKFDDIAYHLKSYRGVHQLSESGLCGLALFYKPDKLGLLNHAIIDIDTKRPPERKTPRMMTALFENGGGKFIEVVNLHLKSKPDFEFVRVNEMSECVDTFRRRKCDDSYLFITGDLNTEPTAQSIVNLRSMMYVREGHDGTEDEHKPTSCKFRKEKRSIVSDYVFYDPHSNITPLRYLSRFDADTLCDNLLPCDRYGSDHMLTCVEFELVNKA